MSDKLPVYELVVEDIDRDGLQAVGLVEFPAIEVDFVLFNKKNKSNWVKAAVDTNKRLIAGPALIPEKLIYRVDDFGQEYNNVFSKETVKQLAYDYLIEGLQHAITEQHKATVRGVKMVESWIVDSEQDKIYSFGYTAEQVPFGSWCVVYKVFNDDILEKINKNEINGFSIEGFLTNKLIENSSFSVDDILNNINDDNKEAIFELLKKMGF